MYEKEESKAILKKRLGELKAKHGPIAPPQAKTRPENVLLDKHGIKHLDIAKGERL